MHHASQYRGHHLGQYQQHGGFEASPELYVALVANMSSIMDQIEAILVKQK